MQKIQAKVLLLVAQRVGVANWQTQTCSEHLTWKQKVGHLVDPGSAAGLDGSIAKAGDRGENWFGYYWSPTAMVGKYG